MRAAASRVSERAFRRQSQRVTRRSAPFATFFHPVPSHSGQTSAETFMDPKPSPLRLCTAKQFRASTNPYLAVYILWRSEDDCGGARKKGCCFSAAGRRSSVLSSRQAVNAVSRLPIADGSRNLTQREKPRANSHWLG